MRFDEVLEQTAKTFHSTPEDVLHDIQELLDEAYANPDPSVREAWSRVPFSGDHPDAREVMQLLAAILRTPETSQLLH